MKVPDISVLVGVGYRLICYTKKDLFLAFCSTCTVYDYTMSL